MNNLQKYNLLKKTIIKKPLKKETIKKEDIQKEDIQKEDIQKDIKNKIKINNIKTNNIEQLLSIKNKSNNKKDNIVKKDNINNKNINKNINNNVNINEIKFNLYYNKLNSINLDITSHEFTAIIVEPRKHKALEFVLNNFIKNLGDRWRFIIYHSDFNYDFVDNIIKKLKNKYTFYVDMISITENNLRITDYSKLLTLKRFYEIIPTEILLIFQTDSIILEKNKNLIYNFLDYDYVGAPWASGRIGNGGLSLRKKSKMISIIENIPYKFEPEDKFFCQKSNNLLIPSFEEAKRFSIESQYNSISFGIHKVWQALKHNEYLNLKSLYPEIIELEKLQK